MPNGDLAAAQGTIDALIAQAVAAAADGLSVQEFGRLAVDVVRVSISILDSLKGPGADKRAIVLAAVGELFDGLADRCVPPVAYPLFLLFRPALRALALAVAAGAIESLLPMVRGGGR